MKKHLQFAVAVLGTVLVTGCGFHLRSSPSLPDDINTVAIEVPEHTRPWRVRLINA